MSKVSVWVTENAKKQLDKLKMSQGDKDKLIAKLEELEGWPDSKDDFDLMPFSEGLELKEGSANYRSKHRGRDIFIRVSFLVREEPVEIFVHTFFKKKQNKIDDREKTLIISGAKRVLKHLEAEKEKKNFLKLSLIKGEED